MTGPDHRSPRCAERRHPRYGRPNIPVADIAEHAADQNQIGREGAGVGADQRRVPSHHLDLVAHPRRGGTRPGEGHQRRVQLDQARPHVGPRGWPATTSITSRPCPAHMLTMRIGPGAWWSSTSRTPACTSRRRSESGESGSSYVSVPAHPVRPRPPAIAGAARPARRSPAAPSAAPARRPPRSARAPRLGHPAIVGWVGDQVSGIEAPARSRARARSAPPPGHAPPSISSPAPPASPRPSRRKASRSPPSTRPATPTSSPSATSRPTLPQST